MTIVKATPKPTESEAVQYLGTPESANEIVAFVKVQAAAGTDGTVLLIHGVPVQKDSWIIKEGPLILVMSNALFVARYNKL